VTASRHIVRRWSTADDLFLRSSWREKSIAEIAAALGRTDKAIKARAYKVLGTTLNCAPPAAGERP
jgi:hypothetical protein